MGKSQDLYKRAKKIIPGGTQLLSKRPELFLPDHWPAYYRKAKGCKIWDLDGNKYVDFSYMGIGACVLGYSDKDVDKAVKRAVNNGSMSTLNAPEEVSLAEELLRLHPWASKVRYSRTGGEAMAIAVRIARAYTGKDVILFCGYHGWHDWYLSSNLADDSSLDGHLLPGLQSKGVPRVLKDTAIPFTYNDITSFNDKFTRYRSRLAAVVMEPVRNHLPKDGFLEKIRSLTESEGIPLIFDEITAGFRTENGGSHLGFGIEPDIAVFGKALGNGYPISAVLGKDMFMDAAQDTFISSTYWTERIGFAAALATIEKFKTDSVKEHLVEIGERVQDIWRYSSEKYGVKIDISGIFPLGHFSFRHHDSMAIKTLFTQLMLEEGFLATTAFYASYAHKEKDINGYTESLDRVLKTISDAINNNDIRQRLKGPVCQSGFRRLT